MIRKPVASGQFYPGSKQELFQWIESIKPKKVTAGCRAKGIIVPHAGYPFSGKVAIDTIAKIAAPKNIIMLGPNHTGLGKDFSLTAAESWQTPCGEVKINRSFSEKILAAGSYIQKDSSAHKLEHSLEVELPLLQYFFKNFQIVPIACNLAKKEIYEAVANQIKSGIKNNLNDTLILASTDLTHYEPDQVARQKDRKVIEAIVDLNPEKMLDTISENNISICGAAPVAIMLYCLKHKLRKAEVVLYQTSGDTTKDYNSVVGYAGIILR